MRIFDFTWKEKRNEKVERHNKITISAAKPNDDIGRVAKVATDLFCRNFGSLKKIDIVSIQEVDSDNTPIGEPITPMDDTAIVPVSK